MKTNKKLYRFKIDLLRSEVAVSFAKDWRDANHDLGKFLRITIVNAEGFGGYAIAEFRRVGIWIGPECSRAQVSHESYHAFVRLCREVGSGMEDEELNAHIVEFIHERVLALWEKKHGLKYK